MAQVSLECEKREAGGGKGAARKLRAEGRVPGVLYGPNFTPVHFAVEEKALQVFVQKHGLNPIIGLKISGATEICMIKDIQRDVYQTHMLHVDMRRIDMKEKVEVNVRLHLDGEDAVRSRGFVVEQAVRTVRVKTLPSDIPEGFTADVSKLGAGKTITIGELPMPKGVELVSDPDHPIVNIFAPRGTVVEEAGE